MEIEILQITDIIPGSRLRSDYGDIPGLMASIKKNGNFSPICLNQDNRIIFGGRRYYATLALHELEPDNPKWQSVNVLRRTTADDSELRELEIEENIARKDMTWQEHAMGLLEIHQLKAKKAALSGQTWTNTMTGLCLGVVRQRVEQILPVARVMAGDANSPLWAAPSFEAAARALIDIKLNSAKVLVAQQATTQGLVLTPVNVQAGNSTTVVKLGNNIMSGLVPGLNQPLPPPVTTITKDGQTITTPAPVEKQVVQVNLAEQILAGHCLVHMKSMKDGSRQHIITDPPYAIDMGMLSQSNTGMDVSSTQNEHEVEENVGLLAAFIPEAFRVLADKGFLAMWCDAMMFTWLVDLGEKAGFAVCRWPWVWCKDGGMNQAAGYNATKATEFVVVMRKKGAVLAKHQPRNWINVGYNAEDKRFTHPFTKPFEVHKWLIEGMTQPGDEIYDPFAGTHSLPCAALQLGRKFISSERAEQHMFEGMTHVTRVYTDYFRGNPNVDLQIEYKPTIATAAPTENVVQDPQPTAVSA